MLALAQVDANAPDTPVKETSGATLTLTTEDGVDVPHADAPMRSAGLFEEPRVEPGILLGRMGMGLLFFGTSAVLTGAVLVVFVYAGAPPVVLGAGGVLAAGLVGLSTALGAAMFGRDYGRDFVDALVVSMLSAVTGGVLFLVGFFVPALLVPMAVIAGGLMVVGVPLVVQALKPSDGPDATLTLLRF